jgi:hypothetical protein
VRLKLEVLVDVGIIEDTPDSAVSLTSSARRVITNYRLQKQNSFGIHTHLERRSHPEIWNIWPYQIGRSDEILRKVQNQKFRTQETNCIRD